MGPACGLGASRHGPALLRLRPGHRLHQLHTTSGFVGLCDAWLLPPQELLVGHHVAEHSLRFYDLRPADTHHFHHDLRKGAKDTALFTF